MNSFWDKTMNNNLNKNIDLHTHTYHSDGVLSPTQLVEKAKETGLASIAITDHDSVSGLAEAFAVGKKLGIEIVPGVEITSYPNEKQEFHLLGYFIDWKNKKLQKILAASQKSRGTKKPMVFTHRSKFGFTFILVTPSKTLKNSLPPSSAGIGKIFITAKIKLKSATVSTNA